MVHIVLLGDSIFDNASYVRGGLDVIAHLRQQAPPDWKATLNAVDGSVVDDVAGQVDGLPGDTTHLVVSAGGNDALMNADILQQKASSAAEVLDKLATVADNFEKRYQRMLERVLSLNKSTAVCTIYYPRMSDPFIQRIAVAALTIFNDVIIRTATMAGISLIDLRLVCNEDADYANEIEPSEAGGRKIAAAIVRFVTEHDFSTARTAIFC
jgi:hypothetical protein